MVGVNKEHHAFYQIVVLLRFVKKNFYHNSKMSVGIQLTKNNRPRTWHVLFDYLPIIEEKITQRQITIGLKKKWAKWIACLEFLQN